MHIPSQQAFFVTFIESRNHIRLVCDLQWNLLENCLIKFPSSNSSCGVYATAPLGCRQRMESVVEVQASLILNCDPHRKVIDFLLLFVRYNTLKWKKNKVFVMIIAHSKEGHCFLAHVGDEKQAVIQCQQYLQHHSKVDQSAKQPFMKCTVFFQGSPYT